MGRPKASFPDLPPRMTGRRVGDKVYYYYQAGGSKRPLGADKAAALREWARIEADGIGSGLVQVADAYLAHVKGFATLDTWKHYVTALDALRETFRAFTLEQILPSHVKTYIRRRTKKGAALFEKRVLSALFNWAREEGITAAANPCAGVKFTGAEKKSLGKLGKRDVLVTDEQYAAVYEAASDTLRDAMDLALLTAQRPSDVIKMTRHDIRDGALWVVQKKTGAKVGIRLEGQLRAVVDRCLARPRKVATLYLVAGPNGQRLRYKALNQAFIRARGTATWQFRDLRAKAASESPSLKSAKDLLGHANETTTTIYRRIKGDAVPPLR